MRFCAHPHCGVMVPKGYCPAHERDKWWQGNQPTPRIRGRRLQRMRAALFDKQPLCANCSAQGKTSIATIRDHVVPLAEGGKDDTTNEQGLCQECSDKKTQAESLRGRKRNR